MSEKAYVYLGICCLLIALLNGLHMYLESELSTKGPELEALETQINALTIQNNQLRVGLLQNESLTVIATKAAAMGLTTHTKYIYLWK